MVQILFKLINNPRNVYYIILFYLAVSVLFSLCYFIILPLFEGHPSLKYNISTQSSSYVNDYFDCFYFSITSQTTVGYGDIIPASFLGKTITAIQVIFGYFYLAFTISIFTCKAILKSDRFKSFLLRYTNEKEIQ